MEYSDISHYSSRLLMAGVRAEVHVELLKSEKAENWFMFTRDLLLKHKILISTLDVDDKYDHPDKSTSIRKNGNMFFKARLYRKALDMYNKCLKSCKPNTECYALAQANRSAAYFHMGQYEHCLKDALCAIESDNYPSGLAYKLHGRIGHVECILGFPENAKKSYALCLKRLDEAYLSGVGKRKFRMKVQTALAKCEEVEELPTNSTTTSETPCVDHLVGGRNANIPALSAFVELKMSKNMIRGVYAARDINPGDIVAIDEPYICGPLTEFKEVCNYNGCMKIDSSLIHCPKCLLVFYCNKDCMNKDYKDGHNLLCPIMYYIKSTPGIKKINELAMKWFLRAYLKMGLKKYCAIVDNFSESKIDPMTRGFDEINQYKSDNFLTAYSMDNNVKKMSIHLLFFYNCIAVDMLHYLMLSGFKIPECDIGIIGTSLVRILTILSFSYSKLKLDNLSVSLTLYPTISLFNHSCDINISPSGNIFGRIKVMKAVQPIPKGTQLCCNYGIKFRAHTKEERQKCCNLLGFNCCCEPCQKNWPTYYYVPNRLSTFNILNYSMADTVSSECIKFVEFTKSVDPKDHYQHLNYLYSFIKILYTNVKRPFLLYEDCLKMIINAHRIRTNLRYWATNID